MQAVKRGFNKATSDASMGSFLSMLEYKPSETRRFSLKLADSLHLPSFATIAVIKMKN